MKLFFFSIIYLFSLTFEIGFVSFFGIAPSVSFWVFILCVYFLNKEDILIFGSISSIFVLIFFTPYSLYSLAIVVVTAGALLIRMFQGLNKKTAFMAHVFWAMIIFESVRVFIFFPGHFSVSFWKGAAADAVFLAVLLAVVIFYEVKLGFNKEYSI